MLFIPIIAETHLLLRNVYTSNRSDLHHVRIFPWRRFDETDIPPSKFELKTYELDIVPCVKHEQKFIQSLIYPKVE